MASLRTALRLSLLETPPLPLNSSSNLLKRKKVSVLPKTNSKTDEDVPSVNSAEPAPRLVLNSASPRDQSQSRTDKDKRKLHVECPRRNQRRTTNFELSDEEANRVALEELSSLISNGARVIVVTGAGLSCASGIPAFRSSKTAASKTSNSSESKYKDDGTIWGKHVESMGTRSAFLKDPLHWYSSFWLKSFAPIHMKKAPSGGHEALSELANLLPNLSVVTQNVDGLQQHTSVAWEHEKRLIEAHGRVGLYRCSSAPEDDPPCPYAEEKVIHPSNFTNSEQETLGHGETMKLKAMKKPPSCPFCNQICLPLALLFDEDYTDHDFFRFEELQEWLEEAEVFMFIGTSFSVTLTSLALDVARAKRIPMFNFNIEKDVEKESSNTLQWCNICGKAEELLPELVQMVKSKQEVR